MATTRRQFTREFKREAVRLVTEGGRPVTHVARELGIHPTLLRAWQRQAAGYVGGADEDVFPGNGQVASPNEELRRLRRENATLRQERDFLNKAAAYFAQESP